MSNFLNLHQLPTAKKDMQKPSITTNVWLFLFCQSFINLAVVLTLSYLLVSGLKRHVPSAERNIVKIAIPAPSNSIKSYQ
jgi:hypothetical protein